MAAVVQILVTTEDAKGKDSIFGINVPTGLTIAVYTAFAQAASLLVNAITTGRIKRIGMGISFPLPVGLRAGALTNSDVEEGAKFQFASSGGHPTGMRIATFDETLIASNSRAVDLEDADVAAYVNMMEDGITVAGTLVTPVDGRGEDVVALTGAKEQFQSSRAE